ncbi:hypothetical protein BX600DRAFT_507009 [Xylariales sp. PMI_506]|nr:hypothetical protein BX600DRAFT_507009 [Xylariales sp. PMI_506]
MAISQMSFPRIQYILLAAISIFLLLEIAHQYDRVRETPIHGPWNGQWTPSVSSPKEEQSSALVSQSSNTGSLPSFYDIGFKHGTDKVKGHHYWFMYDKYLPAIRNKKLKMLEIGLGCNMDYGPGASYYTWLEYFPNVDLYYIEYDADCAKKWAAKTTGATIYVGDQEDIPFLKRFINDTGGDFDIIIDDGGHTMKQQINSIETLWGTVKPGGMYFVEDLETSYVSRFGGDTSGGRKPEIKTMAKYIYELMDDKFQPDGTRHAISMEMRAIECQRQICAFFKKEAGGI